MKNQKRQEANERQEARIQRTPKEQSALLDWRPGDAARERARLQKMIDAGNEDTRGLKQYKGAK